MAKKFHDEPFDDDTQLKLDIFRGYIREWLPVFLTGKSYSDIHIYDFFAGPGTDIQGHPGSPLIILQEIEASLNESGRLVTPKTQINIHFNDEDQQHVQMLKQNVRQVKQSSICSNYFSDDDFGQALNTEWAVLQSRDTACLVLMDQCGLKHVTKEVFVRLARCPKTDILFFISSSIARRFKDVQSIRQCMPYDPVKMGDICKNEVHRYICECYRSLVPDMEYYIAPFSILKSNNKANVYGVIFGSSSVLGLFKFLTVCWDQDKVTGEANYNIDEDCAWHDAPMLFPEMKVHQKQDQFERKLLEALGQNTMDNHQIFKFCLESGFLPKHGREILRRLQEKNLIEVMGVMSSKPPRKGAFYLRWDEYNKREPRVKIRARGIK